MWLTTARGPGPNRLGSERDEQAECRDWVAMRMAVGIFCREESRRRETSVCQASHVVGEYDNGRWGRKAKMTGGIA